MAFDKLDGDFRSTCHILFGQEIGSLEEFGPYLSEMMFPYTAAKSSISGKEVMLSGPHYPKGAMFVSQDEITKLEFSPLSINDIKDIDSLFEAASERAFYCGNKIFGTNLGVSQGDNCADCIEVRHSHDIYSCKHAAHCSIGRFSESLYGVNAFWKANYSMRCMHCFFLGSTRCFETYYASGIADSYYTYNCSGCSDCIFCFNLRSKNRCIGNLQLPKERYAELKGKLVFEMAEKLKKDKRLFSLADIVQGAEKGQPSREDAFPASAISPIVRNAFASTSRILLWKEHALEKLGPWLLEKAIPRRKIRGAFGSPTYLVDTPIGKRLPKSRMATLEEALAHSSKTIELPKGESPSLEQMAKKASKIALFSQEFEDGKTEDSVETVTKVNASQTYGLWWAMGSTHSAFSSIVTESQYIFGGYIRVLNSEFCINCHNVTHVSGCFECDSCYQCRNCYFCHNCENVEEGLFCFNAKGLRYAICNKEVGKAEFLRIKKLLLEFINSELEKKGRLEKGIFSLGVKRKNG